jgi:uncharacterized membrane protein
MHCRMKLLTIAVVASELLIAPGSATSAPSYTFTDLGALTTGNSQAHGINASGEVTGYARSPEGSDHPALWRNGEVFNLQRAADPYEWRSGYGYSINDNGWVAGIFDLGTAPRAAVWDGANRKIYPSFLAVDNRAFGINNAGIVVGYAIQSPTAYHGVVWTDAGANKLTSLGGDYTIAYSINNAGQIVGYSQKLGQFTNYAVGWNVTSVDNPIVLSGTGSVAYGNNDLGEVVGLLGVQGGGTLPVRWSNGQEIILSTLGANGSTAARDINNLGNAVGFSVDPLSNEQHAALWTAGQIYDLNVFLSGDLSNSGWYLSEANAINDSDWIAGTAINRGTGARHAFLLSMPIPEPETYLLLLLGLGIVTQRVSQLGMRLSIGREVGAVGEDDALGEKAGSLS